MVIARAFPNFTKVQRPLIKSGAFVLQIGRRRLKLNEQSLDFSSDCFVNQAVAQGVFAIAHQVLKLS